jgi:hypothetical protein
MHIDWVRLVLMSAALALPLGACNGDDKRETDSIADLDEGSCTPGELDCECSAGQCLGDLECVEGTCVSPSCTPGELGCECNGGQCLGDLECADNVCIEGAGTSDSTEDGDSTDNGETDDGETGGCGAGEMLCDGVCTNVQTDDANCGMCGNACDVVGETGGCVNGMCAPALSECVLADDPPKSCNEICADFGKTCVDSGCDGVTYVWYGAFSSCEDLSGSPNQNDCTNPTLMSGTAIRCCCQA